MENAHRRRMMFPWEYALGDKAYIGCPEFLCEYKCYGGQLDESQRAWNNMLQFYRGRNEHLVSAIKHGRSALEDGWRGDYMGLAAVIRVISHMVALEQRMAGPRYDCYGPFPVCPDEIVERFL